MLQFEWDPAKAESNLKKHGVDFGEAATASGDPRSLTIPDPERSLGAERFILVGVSYRNRLVVVAHAEDGDVIRGTDLDVAVRVKVLADVNEAGSLGAPGKKLQEITRELPGQPVEVATRGDQTSAPAQPPPLSAKPMSTTEDPDEMREEYDFRGAVRGKYAERFAEGSNVVVLAPDVAEVFTDGQAVNDALRVLADSIRQVCEPTSSSRRSLTWKWCCPRTLFGQSGKARDLLTVRVRQQNSETLASNL